MTADAKNVIRTPRAERAEDQSMLRSASCEGCGVTHEWDARDEPPIVRKERSPGVEVVLCRSGRNSYGAAKKACLDRARLVPICPGCGADWQFMGVCQDCRARLAREVEAEAEGLIVVGICDNALMPYLGSDLGRRLGSLLAMVARGRGAREARSLRDLQGVCRGVVRAQPASTLGRDADRYVEMTPRQHKALQELAEEIWALMASQQRKGREEGHSALVGLATGRVSADQFYGDLERRR